MPFGRSAATDRAPDADTRLAAARLEKELQRMPSSSNYHWAALGRLLIGDVDGAIVWLQNVTTTPPSLDASCDLAAAYMVRWQRRGDHTDLARAIDAAQRGLSMSASRTACWFNLGLSLSQLGLAAMANEAFERAAAFDNGPWAEEGRTRQRGTQAVKDRNDLSRRLEPLVLDGDPSSDAIPISVDGDVIEEILERRVMRRWADAIRSGQRLAAAELARRAHVLAERLAATNGDRFALDLVTHLSSCDARCATAWIDHLDALTDWDAEHFVAARSATARADAIFGTRPSTVNASRILLHVTLARLDGDSVRIRDWLRQYETFCDHRKYARLMGRLMWQSALIKSEAGNFGGSIAIYRKAGDWLDRSRDREGMAMVNSLLSSKYQQLGEFAQAWSYAARALHDLFVCRELRQRAILAASAALATASSLDEAALAFRAPMISAARGSGPPIYLARLLSDEATTLMRLGRTGAARDRIEEAAQRFAEIDDPGGAAMIRALVLAARGRLNADSPMQAASAFRQAIEIYQRRGNFFATSVLELERGRALLRAGAMHEAEEAFVSGIEVAERERQSGVTDDERVALLGARWDLYAALVDLRIKQGDEIGALSLLDRARAMNLREHLRSGKPRSQGLPDGTVALEYAVLPSGVSAWITVRDKRVRFSVGASGAELAQEIDAYRAAILRRTDPAEIRHLSRQLFNDLCGPVGTELARAMHIVVVPDGPLHELPFASLEDPTSGSTLIEQASVTVTPSLELYLTREHHNDARPYDVVIIGNPGAVSEDGGAFSRLPAVDREVQAIASLYGRSEVLEGGTSTREGFLHAAPLGRVVHFAGHAVVDDQQPSLSRLLVSRSSRDGVGAVFARDLAAVSFAGVQIVMLSACDTARGRVSPGEGVMGLARAFLGAGAASVIATLWPVDDEHAFHLALATHRALIQGHSASDALREAQLTARGVSKNDLADWAGTILIGRDVAIDP
jgi:CHAT domain-containing protein